MTIEEYNSAVDQYSDGLYRFVLKNLRDADRAQDVVQDTFEKLWVKKDTVNGNKVKSYLFTTAYHALIDVTRKDKRMDDMENVSSENYSHDHQYSDLKEILNSALDKISDIQRTVILLRDYEGYSYQEIGEITKLTEAQVKITIFRGRVALKEYLKSVEALI